MHASLRLALCLLTAATGARAATPTTAPDFSGTYACTGQDASEGAYTSTVTLQRVAAQSAGGHTAYSFRMEVPGYGTYLGHAAADGRHAAIHFALTDPVPQDFGTGLAAFRRGKGGKWQFSKWYYEPAFKGGNHGTEQCRQQ